MIKKHPYGVNTIISLRYIVETETQRILITCSNHRASKWPDWDLNPRQLAPDSISRHQHSVRSQIVIENFMIPYEIRGKEKLEGCFIPVMISCPNPTAQCVCRESVAQGSKMRALAPDCQSPHPNSAADWLCDRGRFPSVVGRKNKDPSEDVLVLTSRTYEDTRLYNKGQLRLPTALR